MSGISGGTLASFRNGVGSYPNEGVGDTGRHNATGFQAAVAVGCASAQLAATTTLIEGESGSQDICVCTIQYDFTATSAAVISATLTPLIPAGFRPSAGVSKNSAGDGRAGALVINPTGEVVVSCAAALATGVSYAGTVTVQYLLAN